MPVALRAKTVDVVGVVVELLGDHLAGQVLVIVLLKVADELQRRSASGTFVGDHLGLRDGDELFGLEGSRLSRVVDLLRFIDVSMVFSSPSMKFMSL